jgi:hypothetical protein
VVGENCEKIEHWPKPRLGIPPVVKFFNGNHFMNFKCSIKANFLSTAFNHPTRVCHMLKKVICIVTFFRREGPVSSGSYLLPFVS